MKILLAIILVGLMAMVLYSLIRGIVAFLKTTKIDLESGDGETVTEMQLLQNKAMFARIKYQALAIVVVAILLAMGGGRG
ncbi:MAG: HIG1 domain-containing protein [Altererythrobacter sp.]